LAKKFEGVDEEEREIEVQRLSSLMAWYGDIYLGDEKPVWNIEPREETQSWYKYLRTYPTF
jgi:hypothetical protein